MVVTIYLLVASLKFPKLAPVIVVLALNAVTMLFWFAAFIALAVWKSNHFSGCHVRFCDTIVAGIVFGAFEWWVFFGWFFCRCIHYSLFPPSHLWDPLVCFFLPILIPKLANHPFFFFSLCTGFSSSSLPLLLLSLSVVVAPPQLLQRPQRSKLNPPPNEGNKQS